MFYCPNCNNRYTKITAGRLENQNNLDIDSQTPTTVSSIIQEDKTKQKGGKDSNYQEIINKAIADDEFTENEIKQIDLDDLVKHIEYKKLNSKMKELVYNKINELIPKNLIDPNAKKVPPKVFFECTNCGYGEALKDNTLVIRRLPTNVNLIQDFEDKTKYKDLVNASELPHTRRYVCPNEKCESHTNPELREAVFDRQNGSYKTIYVCKQCQTII
jgi:uncharacterized protein with PIN domain